MTFILSTVYHGPSNFTSTQRLLGFYFERGAPVVPGQITELTVFHGGRAASQRDSVL